MATTHSLAVRRANAWADIATAVESINTKLQLTGSNVIVVGTVRASRTPGVQRAREIEVLAQLVTDIEDATPTQG